MTQSMPAFKLLLSAAILFVTLPLRAQSPGYDQPYRPQIHYSPQRNWTNDPNGLVYFHGEYHLFYQYNPFGDLWGHMSWGHAVSTDLLHWHELPVAIPEAGGVAIYTGSIVVDHDNTSGLCFPKTECLVAVYTGHRRLDNDQRQAQYLAYSQDNGRTWTQYTHNPILDLDLANFRDPSVSWDAHARHWVMSVALPKDHKIRFYSSPNLKDWTQLSDFGPAQNIDGDWECPDLLQIPSATGKDSIWALKIGLNHGTPHGGSGEQYFLGNFDGHAFTPSTDPGSYGWTNYGRDDYCAISYNGIPANQKPVLIGWMNNWSYARVVPTSPWRGQFSLPRRLSFLRDSAGLALKQEPIVTPLAASTQPLPPQPWVKPLTTQTPPYELDLNFLTTSEKLFGLRLYSDPQHWTEIGFDRAKQEFYIDRTNSSMTVDPTFPSRTAAPLAAGRATNLKLIVDRSSVEAFAQDGTIAMTDLIFSPTPFTRLELFSSTNQPIPTKGTISTLSPIWPSTK